MRMLSSLFALALLASAGCTNASPTFCCLSLENCQQFEVDEVRECAGEQVCVANECVPTPDAPPAPIDGAGPGPDAADPCFAAGGQIVFQSDRDGDFEIARALADGSGFELLTDNTWADSGPVWSRDSSQIAWRSVPTGMDQVWVMNADGTDPHLVSGGSGFDPQWSPATDRLVFTRYLGTGTFNEIYGVNSDGTSLANLSQAATSTNIKPSWAPDGSRIVFSRNNQIFIMNSDGGSQGIVRPAGTTPKWSPSGAYIAFVNSGLVRTTPTGVGEVPLYSGVVQSFNWSRDSSKLVVCAGNTLMHCDLSSVASAGGTPAPIAMTGDDFAPVWSPDGSRVAFTSTRDGNEEIYVANADGNAPTNITMDPGADRNPQWAPCSP